MKIMGIFKPLSVLFFAACVSALALPAKAQTYEDAKARIETALQSIVRINTKSVPNARSNATLGDERAGNGILIENDLVLTIGYIVLEADEVEVTDAEGKRTPATVAGYDHTSGFGLVRLVIPSKAKPVSLGASKSLALKEPVLSVPFGGIAAATPSFVVSKRVFTGSWEYKLDEALYTAPPIGDWGGAGLFSKDGALVGVGSLLLRDADGEGTPGNMFVPIDILKPILTELKSSGRVKSTAKPWLGVTTEERARGLVVSRVTKEGPAEAAGLEAGDVIVSVNGKAVKTQAELYDAVWAQGSVGVTVTLGIASGGDVRNVRVKTIDRMDFLKPRTVL
jgi:serine protease Do